MHKHLLILLILSIQLFAFSTKVWIVAKAEKNEDLITIKMGLKSDLFNERLAKRKKLKPEFITNIIAKTDNKIIYEVQTGKVISRHPFIEFKIRHPLDNQTIEFIIIDNRGNIKNKLYKIKDLLNSELRKEPLNYLKNKPMKKAKIWETKTLNNAINSLYNSSSFMRNNKLQVKLKAVQENSLSIPITVRSKLELESIAIFQDSTEEQPLIAVFPIYTDAIVDYSFRFKLKSACEKNIVIIAKGKDEKLYRVDKAVTITGGDMNCDGTSNGGGG